MTFLRGRHSWTKPLTERDAPTSKAPQPKDAMSSLRNADSMCDMQKVEEHEITRCLAFVLFAFCRHGTVVVRVPSMSDEHEERLHGPPRLHDNRRIASALLAMASCSYTLSSNSTNPTQKRYQGQLVRDTRCHELRHNGTEAESERKRRDTRTKLAQDSNSLYACTKLAKRTHVCNACASPHSPPGNLQGPGAVPQSSNHIA